MWDEEATSSGLATNGEADIEHPAVNMELDALEPARSLSGIWSPRPNPVAEPMRESPLTLLGSRAKNKEQHDPVVTHAALNAAALEAENPSNTRVGSRPILYVSERLAQQGSQPILAEAEQFFLWVLRRYVRMQYQTSKFIKIHTDRFGDHDGKQAWAFFTAGVALFARHARRPQQLAQNWSIAPSHDERNLLMLLQALQSDAGDVARIRLNSLVRSEGVELVGQSFTDYCQILAKAGLVFPPLELTPPCLNGWGRVRWVDHLR